MKKMGLVGGISWVSTMDYYKLINEGIHLKLGGLNFAECILYSLNFGDIQSKSWDHSFELLLKACESLERSGAEMIALCANTAHMFADQLQEMINLPFVHIVTETAKAVSQQGIKKVGLLGTQFTMEREFYREKLETYGLAVLVPEQQATRDYMQFTLKEELGIGFLNPETKARYLAIIQELVASGAEGIILGCTEIPLLINQEDCSVPLFDTTKIHVQAIVEYATLGIGDQ